MNTASDERYSPEARTAQEWRRIAGMRDEDVSLAEGALWIAASEYPGLAIDDYLACLHDMAAKLRGRLRADIATADKLMALNRYLFDELGFSGNSDDFYDPRNSFLNEVIERRVGIPITLGVVYIEIGRRIGLGLHGVSFPGHFLVKCALRDGIVVLDPYSRGVSLDADELQQRLRAAGSPGDVDGAILALVAWRVNQFKLGVLLSCIAGVFRQLLDGIIQGPVEKNQALASIGFLGKVPAHYTPRNVEVDCLFTHGPHLSESDAIGLEFRVCGPFQHLVSMCVTRAPDSVMCKNLKLRTIEGTFGWHMMSWWRNNAVDRP